MTAYEIFKSACAYLSQTPEESDDLADLSAEWLNVILQEALATENNLRSFDGSTKLSSAPKTTAEMFSADGAGTGTLDYHESLRTALVYGLAADFLRDDDNADWSEFRARFINALTEAMQLQSEAIADLYSERIEDLY